MRKIIALILCLIFVLSLSGCALVKKNVSWETIEVEVDDPNYNPSSDENDSSEDTSADIQTDSSDNQSSKENSDTISSEQNISFENDSKEESKPTKNESSKVSKPSKNESSKAEDKPSKNESSKEESKPQKEESSKQENSSENIISSDLQNSSDNSSSQIVDDTSSESNEDVEEEEQTVVEYLDPADKPTVENPGDLSSTVPEDYESAYGSQAKAMRDKVLSAKDTLKAKGKTYYVSPKGSDDNNGTSKETPWQSLYKLNEMKDSFKAGDVVLLERGYVYRTVVAVELVSGVSYGAYGTGDKPCVYGSAKNYVNATWVDMGNNIWKTADATIRENVGLIVFNHGEQTGFRYNTEKELSKNYDFCSSAGMLTLYLDKDPSKEFYSIEVCQNGRLYDLGTNTNNITIENICFKYTGGHAVRGSACSDIIVRGLEIGYVGGSILTGFGNGNVRYGNGVEFMGNSQNVLVENNWIYQIYDSGVTHQGDGAYHLNGFTVKNNLIEYCGMGSIEYWHTGDNDISNVSYEGNLLRFAGYGFGGTQRPDKEMTGHIMSNGKPTAVMYNKASNFVIKNNLFELSTYQLVNATSSAGTPPVLSGNTYVQWDGKWLGYYENNNNTKFGSDVKSVIKDSWGDKTAIIEYAN